jgi:hypothetical protein
MTLRALCYCIFGGLTLTIASLGTGGFAWWWLAGIVLAGAFFPVAVFGPAKTLAQFAVLASVLMVVSVFCTWTEALLFLPLPEMREHPLQSLFGPAFLYVTAAVVLALLARTLKLTRPQGEPVEHRTIPFAVVMVFLCGIAYAIYYLIFGAITYQYFTKQYYPDATQLVANLGVWFWPLQIGRGLLMTLAVLPVIYTLRMKRWHAAIVVGLIVWVAGGLTPLIPPNPFMGAPQRFIHVIEIFTQNFSIGVTAALLLRPKDALHGASARPSPAVHA